MKFISFNINGLRARPHQLEAIIEKYQPDVIGLQEIKGTFLIQLLKIWVITFFITGKKATMV